MKMIKVIAINATLISTISNRGDAVSGATKSGRNARKKMDSFGLRILSKKPRRAICRVFFRAAGELNVRLPDSRHIDQAR